MIGYCITAHGAVQLATGYALLSTTFHLFDTHSR